MGVINFILRTVTPVTTTAALSYLVRPCRVYVGINTENTYSHNKTQPLTPYFYWEIELNAQAIGRTILRPDLAFH
ncbi:hypothetical protein VINE108274_13705 [Vibrio neptunius]